MPVAKGGAAGAVRRGGDSQVDVGKQAQGAPAMPGPLADHLAGVQAGGLLGDLLIFFDPPPGHGDG